MLPMKTLHLLDASSFIYRGFFALPPLSTSKGFPTGAIYGFLRMLFSILKSESPQYMAVVFDSPAPPKREAVYREYKAGRPPMPDPLKVQIPVIKEILNLMNIPTIEKEGYEADDLIAILANRFAEKGFMVKIYTPDKDMLQLVRDNLVVINPMNWETFTPQKVEEKFGVKPEKVPDFLALVGDQIDNIKGVKGIGPKSAKKLIEEFGGVEGILNRWEEFSKRYPDADRDTLELSYMLVKPMLDANIEIEPESLRLKEPRKEELIRRLEELEMKSLIKELDRAMEGTRQGSLF